MKKVRITKRPGEDVYFIEERRLFGWGHVAITHSLERARVITREAVEPLVETIRTQRPERPA